uniref:Phosphatidylinositol-glycan biosynthesis class S protein n=1 Tax=Triatoma infestans TaxID=30076 RepID=A0A161MCH7_TRIIF
MYVCFLYMDKISQGYVN